MDWPCGMKKKRKKERRGSPPLFQRLFRKSASFLAGVYWVIL